MDISACSLKDDDSFYDPIALDHGASQEEEEPLEGEPHMQDDPAAPAGQAHGGPLQVDPEVGQQQAERGRTRGRPSPALVQDAVAGLDTKAPSVLGEEPAQGEGEAMAHKGIALAAMFSPPALKVAADHGDPPLRLPHV